tara:strand:+ start:263 stop:922 length:660 start_codon:yes stop_codon:yes gene_type:complete
MTTLIIARHGNTFNAGDTPTRVGARTDMPLVEKGKQQAAALGQYLKTHNLLPDAVYSSTLQRTKETAKIALEHCGVKNPVYALKIFDEIDYGPDENQTEDKVIARIGQDALTQWDKEAIVPNGWAFDPKEAIQNWNQFAHQATKTHDTLTNIVHDISETILVVTSNGIARFAPYITNDFDAFARQYPIKLSTGALGILEFSKERWHVKDWNIRPDISIK